LLTKLIAISSDVVPQAAGDVIKMGRIPPGDHHPWQQGRHQLQQPGAANHHPAGPARQTGRLGLLDRHFDRRLQCFKGPIRMADGGAAHATTALQHHGD
jgi:hypothetical protein